jgi:hypothetical protein
MPNTLAWGFTSLYDVFSRRVSDLTNGGQLIRDAVVQSAAEYSRQANSIMSILATRTTQGKEKYQLTDSATLQPLDEWGNPKPRRSFGSYDVAYPIQGGGDAWGDNRVSRALMTVEQANDFTLSAMKADADWLIRHALGAIFGNAAWTFDDQGLGMAGGGLGTLSIQPLASGDSVTYVKRNGIAATDNHYYAQAAAIADGTNPFPGLVTELEEHPGNGTGVAFYVPTNLVSAVTGLAEFTNVGDPNVTLGSASPVLNSDGASALGFGDKVLGYLKSSRAWVVEYSRLPDSYLLGLPLNPTGTVLKMREYDAPALQGFFPEFHSPDGNLQINRMIRYAGFGVSNRVGAVAGLIGNGTYSAPTGFQGPMAV